MTSQRPAGVPVLMYHEVAPVREHDELARVSQRNYTISTELFAAHLEALRQTGARTITLSELRSWQRDGATIPERAVVLTFDDGFAGNYRHALPMLREHGHKATFFVVTGKIGTSYMMDWVQVRALHEAGMDVQSHTATHPLFSCIDRERTTRELVDSKREIEERLGALVRHLSLPYGDSNPWVEDIARANGYESACSSIVGLNQASTDPFQLRRIAITTGTSGDVLARIASRDPVLLGSLQRKANLKRTLARFLGKRNYDRLVNLMYGVHGHENAGAP